MSTIFERCFAATVEDPRAEGGYVLTNHPADPGGMTFAGISRRYHPSWEGWPGVDTLNTASPHVPAELIEQVKAFYHRTFWQPVNGDRLPAPIAHNVFDMAVNSGVDDAVKALQTALGTVWVDGVLGSRTVAAVQQVTRDNHTPALVMRFNAIRLRHYTSNTPSSAWAANGRGWTHRVAHMLMLAAGPQP